MSEQFQSHIEKKKCYTVGTVPKPIWKTINATLLEQFQSPI